MKSNSERNVIHAIVLGDDMVGKTCMAHTKLNYKFNEDYIPTIFENFEIKHKVGDEDFTISLFDTAGLQHHRNLRSFVYGRCQVIIMCYSVCDKDSYQNVVDYWMPEVIAETRGLKPIILVGMQADTRGIVFPELEVDQELGHKLAKQIGADNYLECSALTKEGVNSVFNNVVYSALKIRKKGSFLKRIFGR
ncbi:hypothetical protein LOTGIDRAFT_204563 [Lottia gigantea]|uniref:Uncharacterized protein n=1 Tax=Lottia gigantea TaxID=225164 RepID=V4BB38_LOTGI|nr:hypothetical protein LOTGIDRAFT_204563 [Lottia gigantea]ESO86199.1 hypothetical protein LOTGIDRAFT_204563 [Lottia gigantea]